MTDNLPKFTKLRLLHNRQMKPLNDRLEAAKKELEIAAKNEMLIKDEIDQVWIDYVVACKNIGYCAFCEKQLDQCEGHIALAYQNCVVAN